MGWDGDDIMLRRVPKLLGPLYAGCMWSVATSFSPVIVRHRKGMTEKQRTQIVAMFPEHIRVEFQETELPANLSRIYGFGGYGNTTDAIQAYWGSEVGAEAVKASMIAVGIIGADPRNPTEEQINKKFEEK